jgi:phosphate transport system substrate-binding protein
VAWPGFGLGVKTNAGIATQVENMPNSLGYIAYSYAVQNHMQMVKMQNQAGKIVTASSESFAQAVKNPDSATSWPMLETAYIVLPNHSSAYARNSAQVLKFFEWVYKNGSPAAEQLGYIALTKLEYEPIEKQWNNQLPNWNK